MEESILRILGSEILSIVTPVSICMLLVVFLVCTLIPHGADLPVSSVAMLIYTEQPSDSDSQKFGGALLNALVFVAIVTVVTFFLVLLFYLRCNRCLKGYMAFSAFAVLAYLGGALAVLLIQFWSLPIDIITFSIILLNFSAVGVPAVFSPAMPILITQCYVVIIGILVAFWFTMLPEWTTWILLVAMAIYDVLAVLLPGGPLNLLVELAMSREEEIPALIYEARPIVHNSAASSSIIRHQTEQPTAQVMRRWRRRQPVAANEGIFSRIMNSMKLGLRNMTSSGYTSITDNVVDGPIQDVSISPSDGVGQLNVSISPYDSSTHGAFVSEQAGNYVQNLAEVVRHREIEETREDEGTEETILSLGLTGAIKLGLGDFIFYSVLVGRAAMYDLMTVYACYLAIIAGLGSTLALLAVCRRALPALPISIALGVIFYFFTRLIMEPFVVQLTTELIFF